jgi:hypothetical protein
MIVSSARIVVGWCHIQGAMGGMMDRLAGSPSGGTGLSRRLAWIVGILLAVLVAVIVVLYLGRIEAVYQLYWGRDQLRRLFYEDVGMSDAWSSFIAVVGSFVYALAWVPLSLWTWRLLAWRFNAHQLVTAFACWVLIYGHVPLVHALLGSDACFNQRTGEPLKWYVQDPNGDIFLFDSGGFDVARATQKVPVTPAICSAFARQKVNGRPHRIIADVQSVEFFDPNNGRPRVWYSKAPDGSYLLFDASGFNPSTGESLLTITKDAVADIMTRVAKDAQDRVVKEEQERTARNAEQARQQAEAQARAEAAARARPTVTPTMLQRPIRTTECPGEAKILHLTQEWMEFNPGEKCRSLLDIIDGSFEFMDGNGVFRPNGFQKRNAHSIRAISPKATVKFSLCPLEVPGDKLRWDCTPQ